jgi:hypothetical protein
MELARYSDMRLTMKTYTDMAQLPLAATVAQLPDFGLTAKRPSANTQILTQNLVQSGQLVSPSVPQNGVAKAKETIENIGENHSQSQSVTESHEQSKWRRGGDSNPRCLLGTHAFQACALNHSATSPTY